MTVSVETDQSQGKNQSQRLDLLQSILPENKLTRKMILLKR